LIFDLGRFGFLFSRQYHAGNSIALPVFSQEPTTGTKTGGSGKPENPVD